MLFLATLLKSYALDQYTDGEDFIVTREADIRENAHAAYTKFDKTPEPAPWKTQRMSHAELLAEAEKYAGQPDVVQRYDKTADGQCRYRGFRNPARPPI